MTQQIFRSRTSDNSLIPTVIFALLIANGLMFALQWQMPQVVNRFLPLYSLNTGNFMPWQLLSYGFLHSMTNIYHILFNMLALWMFGRDLERIMGAQRFLVFWIVCVVGAGVVQLLASEITGQPSVTVGASGGVFGLLLAFAMAFPNRIVVLLIPPIPMKAKYFVLIYGLITLFLGISGGVPSVAHFAHLGGMLFGYLLLRYWSRIRAG